MSGGDITCRTNYGRGTLRPVAWPGMVQHRLLFYLAQFSICWLTSCAPMAVRATSGRWLWRAYARRATYGRTAPPALVPYGHLTVRLPGMGDGEPPVGVVVCCIAAMPNQRLTCYDLGDGALKKRRASAYVCSVCIHPSSSAPL